MKTKNKVLLSAAMVAVAALASPFALFAAGELQANWLPSASSWGLFNDPSNWAIGTADSETHEVPGLGYFIYLDKNMMMDLGGGTHTVDGLSLLNSTSTGKDNGTSTLTLTNGTLHLQGNVSGYANFTLWDGATLTHNSSINRRWGSTAAQSIIVHSGARFEEIGRLIFQLYQATVEAGGTYIHALTSSYGVHYNASKASFVKNYGRFEAREGIKRTYSTESSTTTPAAGSVTYYNYPGGSFLLGGNVERVHQHRVPFRFEFHGGTLEITNSVAFADDMNATSSAGAVSYVKVMEDAALAIQVDQDSSFSLKNVTYGDGCSVTKTGPGKMTLGDAAIPSLVVSAGTVEVALGSVLPSEVSFLPGSTLLISTVNAELAPTAYDGMAFAVNSDVIVSGAVLLRSSDPDFLSYAENGLRTAMPAGFGVAKSDGGIVVTSAAAHQFDPTISSDLSDPEGWGGTLPSAEDDVVVSGSGTAVFSATTPKFKSITVGFGATLSAVGGTEESPLDLPAVELDYDARLLVPGGSVVLMTNNFTCVTDGITLPVLEIATNAMAIVQSPEHPWTYSPHDKSSYHGYDYGFRIKNVSLKWYGTIKMFYADALKDGFPHCRLTLGYAAADETSYIAIDCRGGRYLAAGEEYSVSRCRTPLVIATPDYGGRVVPVGTLLFRDYVRENQVSAGDNQELSMPGIFIGMTAEYNRTGNPDDIEYDVVFEGNTDLSVKGNCRIAGGAHVHLRGPAQWRYARTGWNEESLYRTIILQGAATLSVEDGAYLDICSSDGSWRGLQSKGTVEENKAFTIKNSRMSLLNWSGSGKTVAEVDNTLLDIGYLRSASTFGNINPVFDGFKSVILTNTLTIAAADVDRGNPNKDETKAVENWNRFVKIGPPLTGTGSIAVSNKLSGTHAVYSMTVVVTNGANTATGTASVSTTASGAPAKLLFSDGANWAGAVVADGNVSLTNLVDGSAAAAVSFAALRIDGSMPIRVWKTGGAVTANDSVSLLSPPTGDGEFSFVAMDEPIVPGDEIELGLYPAAQPLPANTPHVMFSARPAESEEFVMLVAMATKPGGIIIIR